MLIFGRNFILMLSAMFVLMLSATGMSAATLIVTTLADTDDAACDAGCSLREAIEAAAVGDTIIFARELRGGTIQLTSPLQIKRRLTIDGPNKRRITIQGNHTFRIFHLTLANLGPAVGRVVTLDGLIIRDGYEADGDGGGIYSDPAFFTVLNITNCAILNNTARRGGGVYVFNSGNFFLIDSTVAGNIATAENAGGGIDISRSFAQIMNSTVSGNRATSPVAGAGGIRMGSMDGGFISDSTITDNSSSGTGTFSAGGLATVGGLFGTLTNTILAKNTGRNPDFYGVSSGVRNSLIGTVDFRSGFTDGVNGSIVGSYETPVDPQLGSLGENGGGLPTHALLPNSQAINAGNNELSRNRQGQPLAIDERGYTRIVNTTVDIGAYEFGASPALTTATVTGQVRAAGGRGIFGARVTLTNSAGEVRFATTNPFGYYRFSNVISDELYTIKCLDKRNDFLAEEVLVEESMEAVNFAAKKIGANTSKPQINH